MKNKTLYQLSKSSKHGTRNSLLAKQIEVWRKENGPYFLRSMKDYTYASPQYAGRKQNHLRCRRKKTKYSKILLKAKVSFNDD